MKLEYTLGGFYLDNNRRVQFPLIIEPSIEKLIKYLKIFMHNDGVLTLSNDQIENCKPYKLVLYAESSNYLVMLETMTVDGDINVRTFQNSPETGELTSIFGECYAKSAVIKEFAFVSKVFIAFLENGDISMELLN